MPLHGAWNSGNPGLPEAHGHLRSGWLIGNRFRPSGALARSVRLEAAWWGLRVKHPRYWVRGTSRSGLSSRSPRHRPRRLQRRTVACATNPAQLGAPSWPLDTAQALAPPAPPPDCSEPSIWWWPVNRGRILEGQATHHARSQFDATTVDASDSLRSAPIGIPRTGAVPLPPSAGWVRYGVSAARAGRQSNEGTRW